MRAAHGSCVQGQLGRGCDYHRPNSVCSVCLTCVRLWANPQAWKTVMVLFYVLIEWNVPVNKTQINKSQVPLSLRIQKNVSVAPSLRIVTARQAGAGEMAEHLRTLAAFPESPAGFPAPHSSSQLCATPVPWNPMPSWQMQQLSEC